MSIPKISAAAALLLIMTAACSPQPAKLEARDGWARETAAGAMGAAYFTVGNKGGGSDRLMAVTSDRGTASLHRSVTSNGIARMRPVPKSEGLEIPAGGELELAPGGAHVMLMDLKAPLKQGERFTLGLQFATSRPQRLEIVVGPATATSSGAPR